MASQTAQGEVSRRSLNLDEFVVIEPKVAGETPIEYCLQDESRPRQFVPVVGFWSKLIPIGKAVTSLASSISPSLNRATIVPCQAGNLANKCCCSRCSKNKRCPLQKATAISSFDGEASPYILQPIKLNSRENSSEEYLMLKIERGNSGDKQENGSVPNGGIPVENVGDFTDGKSNLQRNGTTHFSSVSRVQYDSGCTELNSDDEEPSLNESQLSETVTGEQPSSIKRTGVCQFTSEPSVDAAFSSCSQVSDLQVGASESLESRQEDRIVGETDGLPNLLDDVQLDSPILVNRNSASGNTMDQVEFTIDRSSPTNTDSISTTATAENPIQYSRSHPEGPSEDVCISGQLNLYHSLPNQSPNFFMKKRHHIHKASSEPTPNDIISSEGLVKIEGNLSGTPGERCASEELPQQQALRPRCKANCKAVSGNNFTEEEIKAIVKEHCHEFVKYMNWQSLLPFLESQNLLDPDSSYHLSNAHISDRQKGNYFLLQVLPTKGHDAYKRFHSCIAQETEHSGHGSLLQLFCSADVSTAGLQSSSGQTSKKKSSAFYSCCRKSHDVEKRRNIKFLPVPNTPCKRVHLITLPLQNGDPTHNVAAKSSHTSEEMEEDIIKIKAFTSAHTVYISNSDFKEDETLSASSHAKIINASVPFTDTIKCGSVGSVYINKIHDITIEIPKRAVPEGTYFQLSISAMLNGPFLFPAGVRPVSPIVWLCPQPTLTFSKPIEVVLPHYLHCENQADTKHLIFMKANHNPINGKFHFKPADGESAFKHHTSYGMLHTMHCCFLCIVENRNKRDTPKTNFSLITAYPRNPQEYSWSIYFGVTYCLSSCMQTFREQFNNADYQISNPQKFTMQDTAEKKIEVCYQEYLPRQWMAGLIGSNKVLASKVDFWNCTPTELTTMENEKMYPPRCELLIDRQNAVGDSMLTVNFSGIEEELMVKIPLRLPATAQNGVLARPNEQPQAVQYLTDESNGEQGGIPDREPKASNRKDEVDHDAIELRELCMELQTVDDWFDLGIYLHIPYSKLKIIEVEYQNTHRRRTEMLQAWLNNFQPSWSVVIEALKLIDMSQLAKRLAAKKFSPTPAHLRRYSPAQSQGHYAHQPTQLSPAHWYQTINTAGGHSPIRLPKAMITETKTPC